ncbi:MAG: hypothetical protein ACLGHN_10955 [Bacteriovoracia bacterium]
MKAIILLSVLLLSSCASLKPEEERPKLEVTEVNPNKWTAITKQNLLHLSQVYDLDPFLFTRKINIESRVIPHSHPVLTLNTRNAEQPKKILATFLHEEMHWWLVTKKENVDAAIRDLKKIFPKVPAENKRGTYSTYLHLIVNYLELLALEHYLGPKEARAIIRDTMVKGKIYPWGYSKVLNNTKTLKRILKKHQLFPHPLS